MSLRVFIGWDSRFHEPARVLAYTLKKHSSIPLEIRFLDYRHLNECYGFDRIPDPLASTEFTYSRFLVPYLCAYTGPAVFMDNDMACFGNIAELYRLCWEDRKALYVRKHEQQAVAGAQKMYGAVQTAYPRKNWSSLMVMNCEFLKLWSKRVVETSAGAYLHRFQDIPDDMIGSVPPGWNDLEDQYNSETTKLLHWTEGGPWYEQKKDCPHADVWLKERDEYRAVKADGNLP